MQGGLWLPRILGTLRHDKAAGLMCPEVGIEPTGGEQVRMCPLFDDPTSVHDHQPVHELKRGKPMCDGDDRSATHQLRQRFLDRGFDLRVERRRCLVEQEDGRVLQVYVRSSGSEAVIDPPE